MLKILMVVYALLPALAAAARPTVSFRLDDVQAWWCEEIVKNVVDEFLAQGVPINLGLIGNSGAQLPSPLPCFSLFYCCLALYY